MPLVDEQKFRIGQRFQAEFQAALGPDPSPRRTDLLGRGPFALPLLNMYTYADQRVKATEPRDSLNVLDVVLDMTIEADKRDITPDDFEIIRSVLEPLLWKLSDDWPMLCRLDS